MSKKPFAVELKKFRLAHGLSQRKLAEKFGVYVLSISNWETGKANPQAATLEKVKGAMAKMASEKPVITQEKKATKAPVKKASKAKVSKGKKATKKPVAPVAHAAPKKHRTSKVSAALESIKGLFAAIKIVDQKLEAHINAGVTSTAGTPADVTQGASPDPAVAAREASALEVLRELIKQIKNSKKDGMVRGATMHVVEWPDICIAYKRAIDLLHLES
jgi:transcriptional regulator with XRE-family HTH domain